MHNLNEYLCGYNLRITKYADIGIQTCERDLRINVSPLPYRLVNDGKVRSSLHLHFAVRLRHMSQKSH
jgi:hypothetical protein